MALTAQFLHQNVNVTPETFVASVLLCFKNGRLYRNISSERPIKHY